MNKWTLCSEAMPENQHLHCLLCNELGDLFGDTKFEMFWLWNGHIWINSENIEMWVMKEIAYAWFPVPPTPVANDDKALENSLDEEHPGYNQKELEQMGDNALYYGTQNDGSIIYPVKEETFVTPITTRVWTFMDWDDPYNEDDDWYWNIEDELESDPF